MQGIDGQIVSSSKETTKLMNKIKHLKEEYAKMICFAYKNRNSFFRIMFLFASEDFNQAFIRIKYVQQIAQYQRRQVELINGTAKRMKDNIEELKTIKVAKGSLVKGQEDEKILLANEKEEQGAALKKIQLKEKELVKSIKQKEKESKKLQQTIETLISEEIKKAAAKKTANITSNSSVKTSPASKELGLNSDEVLISNNFTSFKGKLSWPTESGIVVNSFGEHPHPVLTGIKVKNNGIDISTVAGAKARAVFEGTVTGVVSVPGANKAVIVRHGEYLSVYSNLSSVFVKTGDKIQTKQNIGIVNTDNTESKTELHFEIWNGKTLNDPINWLSKK